MVRCRISGMKASARQRLANCTIMPTAAELRMWKRIQASAPASLTQNLVANMPEHPADIKKRFPSMAKHDEKLKDWMKKLILGVSGGS
jgi:hypothetical protein